MSLEFEKKMNLILFTQESHLTNFIEIVFVHSAQVHIEGTE